MSAASPASRLRDALFPVAAPARLRPATAVGAVAFVLVAAGIQLLRFPASLGRLWAEDGLIFLQQAHTQGRLHAYAEPYAGYIHAIPRTAAAVVASFPLSWAAVLFAVISAFAVAGFALLILTASRGHIASLRWRLVLAATLVLLPIGGLELVGNGVNLQWYAMCAMFWALLWRPGRASLRVLQVAVCFATALSDPLTALFLPLVALRLYALRDWREQTAVMAWAAGLAIQGAVALTTPVPHSTDHASALTLARVTALRVFTPVFLGDNGTQTAFSHLGWGIAAACTATCVALVLAAVVAARRGRLPARVPWMAAVAVGTAVLFFAVPVETRWTPLYVPAGRSLQYIDIGARYVAVPLVALWSAIVVALACSRRSPLRVAATAVTLAMFGCMWGLDFSVVVGPPGLGPHWRDEVAAARARCASDAQQSVRMITAPPNGLWTVTLPCSEVR